MFLKMRKKTEQNKINHVKRNKCDESEYEKKYIVPKTKTNPCTPCEKVK